MSKFGGDPGQQAAPAAAAGPNPVGEGPEPGPEEYLGAVVQGQLSTPTADEHCGWSLTRVDHRAIGHSQWWRRNNDHKITLSSSIIPIAAG